MNIPSKEDWGDLSDLDKAYAYKKFNGKSNEEMQAEYKRNIMARCSDFYAMPISVFAYYVYGLFMFIKEKDFNDPLDITSAIDCLFSLLLIRAKDSPEIINRVFSDFRPLMQYIAKNQSLYDADQDIYGSFDEQLKQIEWILQ